MKLLIIIYILLYSFSVQASAFILSSKVSKTSVPGIKSLNSKVTESDLTSSQSKEAVSELEQVVLDEAVLDLDKVVSDESVLDIENGKEKPVFDTKDSLLPQPFLELGLEYPMNFGIQLKYLFYEFSYIRFGFGFMSGFFLESFEKLSSSFGYLNQYESKVLSDTFKNSMYLDFRLGWIPYFKETGGGPYIELGLSNALLGKGELKGVNLSKAINANTFDELQTYSAKTTSYNATVHIGYSIPFEKIKLNLEVGLVKILNTTFMGLDDSQIAVDSESLSTDQKKIFQDFLQNRGWIFPTFSGWISFSF